MILEVLHLLEDTDLKAICAFRMAAKDIRAGKLKGAAHRIQGDFDKANPEQRKVLGPFIAKFLKTPTLPDA